MEGWREGKYFKVKNEMLPRSVHNDVEMSESGTTPPPSTSPTGYGILSLDMSPGFHK